jgi:arylsulfatase A-like enzyme
MLACALPLLSTTAALATEQGSNKHNILFIILDDVGADQLNVSNPVGKALGTLPVTPTIDAIAAQGVNFTNCWAMSECSPSRVCFFTGRYPTRTGVGAPLVPGETLPQSQCSPFEWTTPKVLNAAGYESVLFGKFHLAHNDFNPYGAANLVPNSIGFTNFNGTLFGAPPPIDATLAGQLIAETRYSCGFPVEGNGPAICACLFKGGADGGNECTPGVDALECLAAGGVPLVTPSGDPILDCNSLEAVLAAHRVAQHWDCYNGYYVWPRTINLNGVAIPATSAETNYARAHADVDQADLAIEFINKQKNKKMGGNWMCTLAFSGDHDPWQQPPEAGVNTPWPIALPYGCGAQFNIPEGIALAVERQVSDRIIESLDSQINRVLVQSGLAHLATDGSLVIDAPDTLIVVIGDNGSFLNTVKFPFSPLRSKGTIYQTGVCVPLVMAGGPTVAPGRAVDSMVNCVDLFQLWGEVAGIDVQTAKPAGRQLDCSSMLPYLTTAEPAPIRTYNFAEFTQPHLMVEATGGPDAVAGPCLLAGGRICTDTILATQEFCEGQGGTWMGLGGSHGEYASCCELAAASPDGDSINLILWPTQCTITNGRWKLVQKFAYGGTEVTCPTAIDFNNPVHALEFYDLADCPYADQLFGRGIDNDECNMLKNTGVPATDLAKRPDAMAAYEALNKQLETLRASLVPITGDVTMDGNVDGEDLVVLLGFWNKSSVADFNNDADTDSTDLAIMIGAWSPNTP